MAVTSTAAHVGFPRKLGRPRIDWLGATFKHYVKMEGRGRPHPSFSTIDPLRDHLHSPLISTIVEPVEPKGLAGFSLCPKVCGVDDMPVSDRRPPSIWQTEIPTDIFVELPRTVHIGQCGAVRVVGIMFAPCFFRPVGASERLARGHASDGWL